MFSDRFSTRQEAFHRERQIKGWSRARKEALIKGDWDGLVELSNRSSGGAILRQAILSTGHPSRPSFGPSFDRPSFDRPSFGRPPSGHPSTLRQVRMRGMGGPSTSSPDSRGSEGLRENRGRIPVWHTQADGRQTVFDQLDPPNLNFYGKRLRMNVLVDEDRLED